MTAELEKKNSSPKLSVVVVSVFSERALENCLDSIFANENQDEVEIIVADCCADESVARLTEEYPNVCFLHFSEKAGIPVLSAAGIKQAAGEIIALTDASCVVDSNWITAILAAHQATSLIIGGAVEMSEQMKLVDLAAYFCEYGQFMPPLNSGAARVLPGNNISFKRSALEIGREYVEPEFWKTFWCQKLQSAGVELIADSSILVRYAKEFKLVAFLVCRFHHGRCFAGMRAGKMPIFKRAFFAAGSISLPAIFLYRTVAAVLGKKRFLKELLLSLPFVVLAIVFWSLGETCGYLAGTGKSCDYIY